MAVPLRGGRGVKGLTLRKKKNFIIRLPLSSRREGGKALMGLPLKGQFTHQTYGLNR